MSWSCSVCQKDFSRKDNLRRHMNRKHSNSDFAQVIAMSQEKCQQLQLVHPFTCMVAGMTGSEPVAEPMTSSLIIYSPAN